MYFESKRPEYVLNNDSIGEFLLKILLRVFAIDTDSIS